MSKKTQMYLMRSAVAVGIFLAATVYLPEEGQRTPVVLQEMTWTDVQKYLETNDMVIIPLGSTEQPKMRFSRLVEELYLRSQKDPELMDVINALQAVPEETKKGGASHELSSNGIWSTGDPKESTSERGEKIVTKMVENAVKFIEAWKQVKE
jgi:creatinine amidohydrolase/Fe(II)-dependent formamide hydrolase-like protein